MKYWFEETGSDETGNGSKENPFKTKRRTKELLSMGDEICEVKGGSDG